MMTKKVCIFTGVGFGPQTELVGKMRSSFGWEVSELEVGASTRPEVVPAFLNDVELIFLRAPWAATFEEALYAEYLAERLKNIFSAVQKRVDRGDKVKILGIGRGAWTLLKANFEASNRLRHLSWEPAHVGAQPWCAYKIFGEEAQFLAQAHSLFLPKVDVQDQGDMKPWMVLSNGQVGGWEISKHVYLAWLDPLSYTHPSQLIDYGYFDYSKMRSADDFLSRFASFEHLEL